MNTLHWPKKHPFTKRYFQFEVGRRRTLERHARVRRMLEEWEDRLWIRGINVPNRLRADDLYLSRLVSDGQIDWRGFPEWVRGGNAAGQTSAAPKEG